jgi:type VI secretion system protein ImpI
MDSWRDPPKLELSLTGPRGRLPQTFQIGAAGGWIGRGRDCEINIDDPDRFVSLKHARIDYVGGQFWLTDQSTNGTHLNDAVKPIESGRRYPLRDGDHFRVGLIDVQVGACSVTEPSLRGELATGESDPLLEFDPGPPAAGLGPSTPRNPLRAPDPLASLLSDLTARPSVPETKSSPNDSSGRFVGTTSQLASRTAAPPSAQASTTPATSAAGGGATSPARPPAVDILSVMAAGIADLSPALEPAGPRPREDEATPAVALPLARPPRPIDPATASVAAFWCGVGIIPHHLGPNDLVDVMGEFGLAFREVTEGLSKVLGQSSPAGTMERNPLGAGPSGLRRYLEQRHEGGMRLDEAVREILSRHEQRDRAYREAVRGAVERMAQSLSASAIERRFSDTDMVRGRFARSREAELWRLFRAFEKEFSQLAEARFQDDVKQQLRREPPGPAGDAGNGFEL